MAKSNKELWLEKYPFGYYNNERDKGTGAEVIDSTRQDFNDFDDDDSDFNIDWDEYERNLDIDDDMSDEEDDFHHANLYGGDTTYCVDCGTKKVYGEDGYSYCPYCNERAEEEWGRKNEDFVEDRDEDLVALDEVYLKESREVTTLVMDMIEEGMVSAEDVARMCLNYLSEDDAEDIANTLIDDDIDTYGNVRQYTNALLDMCEEGALSWDTLALECLNYMSEDDVSDMAHSNELIDDEEEDTNTEFDTSELAENFRDFLIENGFREDCVTVTEKYNDWHIVSYKDDGNGEGAVEFFDMDGELEIDCSDTFLVASDYEDLLDTFRSDVIPYIEYEDDVDSISESTSLNEDDTNGDGVNSFGEILNSFATKNGKKFAEFVKSAINLIPDENVKELVTKLAEECGNSKLVDEAKNTLVKMTDGLIPPEAVKKLNTVADLFDNYNIIELSKNNPKILKFCAVALSICCPTGILATILLSIIPKDCYQKLAQELCRIDSSLKGVLTKFVTGEAFKESIANTSYMSDGNLSEGWAHFEFTSGSNPYIAKTEEEKKRLCNKWGKDCEFKGNINGNDYYVINDKTVETPFVDDIDEGNELKESILTNDGYVTPSEGAVEQFLNKYGFGDDRYQKDVYTDNASKGKEIIASFVDGINSADYRRISERAKEFFGQCPVEVRLGKEHKDGEDLWATIVFDFGKCLVNEDLEGRYCIVARTNDGKFKFYKDGAFIDDYKEATIFTDMDEARSEWFDIDKSKYKRVFIPNYDESSFASLNESDNLHFIDKSKRSAVYGEDDYGYDEFDVKDDNPLPHIKMRRGNRHIQLADTSRTGEEGHPIQVGLRGRVNKFESILNEEDDLYKYKTRQATDDDYDPTLSQEEVKPNREPMSLQRKATIAYKNNDDDFFYSLSDDELVTLWVGCSINDNNPYGAPYDDEVYNAINDRPNARELFDRSTEMVLNKMTDYSLKKVYIRYFKKNPTCDRSQMIAEILTAIKNDSMNEGVKGNSKQLKEGAGAGYTLSGKMSITAVESLTPIKFEDADYGSYDVTFNCVALGKIEDFEFYSYMYGDKMDSAEVEISAVKTNFYCGEGIEDIEAFVRNNLEEVKNCLVGATVHIDYVYGAGWMHSKFDGTIAEIDNTVKDSDIVYGDIFDIEVFEFDAKIRDTDVINYVDKAVTGDNFSYMYTVIDEDGNPGDAFFEEDDAIEYAKRHHCQAVDKTEYKELFGGETEWLDSEIVWENPYEDVYDAIYDMAEQIYKGSEINSDTLERVASRFFDLSDEKMNELISRWEKEELDNQ